MRRRKFHRPSLLILLLLMATSFNSGHEWFAPSLPAASLPRLDICLLQDETGSFWDDIENLQTAAPALYEDIIALSPDAHFAVAGFRDYPIHPCGRSRDWVYHLLSTMQSSKTAWLSGIHRLAAHGGCDRPEAQYDAIVAAAGPFPFVDPRQGLQRPCGWRSDESVQRLLIVITDAPFQLPAPGMPHQNDFDSTLAALQSRRITLIGLKGPTAGPELDDLAAATGGTVHAIQRDGAGTASAIIAALKALP